MRLFHLLLTTVFFLGNLNAQEAAVSSGIEASSTSGTVSATIGQVFYTYQNNTTSGSVTQGVQQSFLPIKTASMLEIDETKLSVFPNPTQGFINLDYPSFHPVTFEVVDVSGKILNTGSFTNSTKLDLSSLASGVYFVIIQNQSNNIVQSVKLIKQ